MSRVANLAHALADCARGVHSIEEPRLRPPTLDDGAWPPDGIYRCLACRRHVELRGGYVRALYPPRGPHPRPPTHPPARAQSAAQAG
jgi:hypothetical protein